MTADDLYHICVETEVSLAAGDKAAIQTEGYPGWYEHNLHCILTITAPPDTLMEVGIIMSHPSPQIVLCRVDITD